MYRISCFIYPLYNPVACTVKTIFHIGARPRKVNLTTEMSFPWYRLWKFAVESLISSVFLGSVCGFCLFVCFVHRLATIHFRQRLPPHKHITHHTAGPSLFWNQRCRLSWPCTNSEHSRLKFWGCTIPTYVSIMEDIPEQACLHMYPQATGTFK